MEKRIFVPQLGREVVFDDSYPQDYVQNYIQQEIAKSAAPPPQQPRPDLSLPQQAGAVMSGIGRGFWGTPVAAMEGLGGITGSQTLLDMARGARESDLGKLLLETPENYRGRNASTAGEIVGNLGSMFVPGAALKGATAGRVATGALSGLQGASEQVQRAEENRRAGMQVSPEDETAAARMGSLTGLLDMIPYSRMVGTIAPKGLKLAEAAAKRSWLPRAVGTGGIESGTEMGQQWLQNLIEGTYNPNQSATEGLTENAVAGGAAGFGMDALLGMLARSTGAKVMGRRQAMEAVPVEASPDAASVGIQNVGGDPMIAYLEQLRAAEQKPINVGTPAKVTEVAPGVFVSETRPRAPQAADPLLNLLRPVDPRLPVSQVNVGAPSKVAEVAPTVWKSGTRPVGALPGVPVEARPAPGIPAPLIDDVIASTDGGGRKLNRPSPGQPMPRLSELLPDARLTDEGTVQVPSRLAMDQPRERFVGSADTAPVVPEPDPIAEVTSSVEPRPVEEQPPIEPIPSGGWYEGISAKIVPTKAGKFKVFLADKAGDQVGTSWTYADQKTAQKKGSEMVADYGKEQHSVATPSTPTTYTVDQLRQEIEAGTKPQIALDIYNEMEALGGEGLFSTRLIDSIATPGGGKSSGTYANRVIQLALESSSKEDLLRTLNHEAVHGMKQMGLFNDAEWAILNAAFNPNTALTDQEREQYGKLYKGDTAKINEEAIARGIERYAAGQINAPKQAVSVAAKAVGAIDRLGNVLKGKGFQNSTDVMEAFRSGEMATREPNLPSAPPAKGPFNGNTPLSNGQANQQVVRPTQNVGPVQVGKRATALADIIDQDEGTEDTRHAVVPQLPVAGVSPFGKPDERTQLKKAIDTFVKKDGLGGFGLKTRQNVLDMRAGIAALGRKAGDTTARTGSEAAVRNYDVAQDFASSALKNGALEFVGTGGDGYFRSNGDTKNAPATVFKEAYEKGKLDQLFHYLAAERADVLRSEGREKKISAADAAAWQAYGNDPEIADYAKRWKAFNDQMVDTLQKSGRIDAVTAAKFKQSAYLPFYRIEEGSDGSVNFQSSGATLASAPRLVKLKGSELDIGDPTDNIVRNVNTLTSMAMKNEAMQRVARDGIQTGFIKQVKEPISGKPNMKVWVNGKEKHFEVLDPILYESVTASRIPSSTIMTIAGFPARVLREGVTLDPVFMVNNPVRDSTMAWLQGYSDFPMQQILQSAYKAITNKPLFQRLEKAGVIGNSIRGEGGAAGTGKTLRESYQGKTGLLHQLEEFSRKSEGITRNTVYESVMKRTGGDEAQAQHEARELLNFNRRGAWTPIQVVNALVPFQNAVWQGGDVLYRTARGHGANPQMQKQLRNRMAMMAGLSAIYTVLASQTPEWQSASEEERDANWFVPVGDGATIKVKIPFEAGYIAKVVPERLTAMYMGHDTGKEFLSALNRFILSTMKLDPIPQAMKPALEVKTNHSWFRDKAIEPEYMRNKEKGQRFDENTSELAKKIGEHTDVLSPLQIDHLLRGYTGAVGIYGTQLAGLLANPEKAKSSMSMAEREPHEIPVLGRFFQREDGGRQIGKFYETTDKAEQAQSALKAGLEATPERVRMAGIERAARPVTKQVQLLTKAEKQVRAAMASGAMSPEEARPLLREYRKRKNELAAGLNKLARD